MSIGYGEKRRALGLSAVALSALDRSHRWCVMCLVAFAAVATWVSGAEAGESVFGWIYTLDLQPKNTWQFEQWEWLQEGQAGGTYHFLTSRSELEYGVTDWYQTGLYLNGSFVRAHNNGVDGTTGGPGTDMPPGFSPNMPYNKTVSKASRWNTSSSS